MTNNEPLYFAVHISDMYVKEQNVIPSEKVDNFIYLSKNCNVDAQWLMKRNNNFTCKDNLVDEFSKMTFFNR